MRIFEGDYMPIIDNKNLTMQHALAKALENADRIDISVAFFYGSYSYGLIFGQKKFPFQ